MKTIFHIDPTMKEKERAEFYLSDLSPEVQKIVDQLKNIDGEQTTEQSDQEETADHRNQENVSDSPYHPDSRARPGEAIIWCSLGTSLVPVKVSDIYTVYVLHEKTFVTTFTAKYEYKDRLYRIRELLPENFLDVSRNATLNTSYIKFLDMSFSGTISVIMKNKQTIQVSRRFVAEFKNRLGL